MDQLITSAYEHKLAAAFHRIDMRGIHVDTDKLAELRVWIDHEIISNCLSVSTNIGRTVYLGAANNPGGVTDLNLNSPTKLLAVLKDLGFQLPKIRRKNKDTHEMEFAESTNDLVLQKTLADPQLWPATTAFDSKAILTGLMEIRGLSKVKGTYVNARLYNDTYYCNYGVASTVTGRRGSRKHIFNLGGNSQNFPKHSELGIRFRECLTSRKGKIFFIVDQVSAEDWPVQALAANYEALDEMRAGVNRHYKFAFIIFGIPPDILKAQRAAGDMGAEMQYYLGKKSRHSNNYGMQPTTMAESLAKEGYAVAKNICQDMLNKVNNADPNVQAVFHKYIQECIYKSRTLITPLGRERQFFGLRANDKNYKILNEAYAQIPQSIVGDNTGLAILHLDGCNNFVIQDGHDSCIQEVPDREERLLEAFKQTKQAFRRTITFHNGIQIEIPIEGELGYNLKDTVKIKHFTEDGLLAAYKELQLLKESQSDAEPEKLAG